MEDKKSLTSSEERAQIKGKASLLAAVDYYVSMHSDIFISASPGNMHNAVVSLKNCNFASTENSNHNVVAISIFLKIITRLGK